MSDKTKSGLVDCPHFDPDLQKLPFPPTSTDYANAEKKPEAAPPAESSDALPYTHTYIPGPGAPCPSLTTPGAPDIRDPHARALTPEELAALNPDPGLKE